MSFVRTEDILYEDNSLTAMTILTESQRRRTGQSLQAEMVYDVPTQHLGAHITTIRHSELVLSGRLYLYCKLITLRRQRSTSRQGNTSVFFFMDY